MQSLKENIHIENKYAGVTLGAINLPRGLIYIDAPPIPEEELDPSLLDSLLRALSSDSPKVREAAAAQLERLGPAAPRPETARRIGR